MIKQSLLSLMCLGLLGLSACSSEKKDKDMTQVVESPAAEDASKSVDAVTQVAENDAAPEAAKEEKEA